MSYLPRMSETYKEPEEKLCDDGFQKVIFNSIPIASALPIDTAFDPQSVLKQYIFYPHPPPCLPGPSLLEEHDEKINMKKKRGFVTKSETKLSSRNIKATDGLCCRSDKVNTAMNMVISHSKPSKDILNSETPENVIKENKVNSAFFKKASLKINETENESINGRKISLVVMNSVTPDSVLNTKPPDDHAECPAHVEKCCTVPILRDNSGKSVFVSPDGTILRATAFSCENKSTNFSKSHVHEAENISIKRTKNFCLLNNETQDVHEGVQCSPFGNNEKLLVVPASIYYVLKTLLFIIRELDDDKINNNLTRGIKIVNQIEETCDFLHHNIDLEFILRTSLTDFKRLRKIYYDLQHYLKQVSKENENTECRTEHKKQIYCEFIQKNYELKMLKDKLIQIKINNPFWGEKCQINKSPEVMLQNKNLENEQLLAEVEFSSQELRQFQHELAEKDWEIQRHKQQISELKKHLATWKPKPSEYLSRKKRQLTGPQREASHL